jgi:dihydroxyacetone kinase, L subunit
MLDSPDALSTWLKSTAAEFEARIDELDGLDAAIGDGDHGTNMARGMATASTIVPSPDTTTRQYLNQVGMALVSSVGGASGPLFGTFFLRVGQLWQSPHSVSSIWQALKAGRDGIASRGRAKVGDKTMLDALCPAVDVLEHAAMERDEEPSASLARAAAAARAGAEATRGMVARRGRAAHYGERSVGHIDPGAVSMAMILDNASRTL